MKIIHNVHILDRSGSMAGSKYNAATQGIKTELKELKEQKVVKYTHSIFEFSSSSYGKVDLTQHCFLESKPKFEFKGASGNTPLYQAVGAVLEKLVRKIPKNDVVLVKIFTDGYHNCNWGITKEEMNELISDLQENHNFTITFIGMEQDVEKAREDLGIFFANTQCYDGTSEGTAVSYRSMLTNTVNFASDVAKGKLKTKKFFENK